jgi:uncharacterized protein (TIGR03089 family)
VPAPNDTPAALLASLIRSDPARPRLTWYDDQPGPTRDERIELSGKVLGNWVAKAANLLQEDLEVGPGSRVMVDLPPHWRAAYWLLGVWSVGAEAVVGPVGAAAAADVVITAEPDRQPAGGQLLAVTLPALARSWSGAPLAAGVVDEAKELATYGDRFDPWAAPGPDDVALTTEDATWTYSELVPAARAAADEAELGEGARAMTALGPDQVVRAWLSAWAVDGSVVLYREGKDAGDVARLERRASAERVTNRLR